MRKIILLLIVGLAVSFTACNKTKIESGTDQYIKNPDPAALAQRFTEVNMPVQWSNTNKSTQLAMSATVIWNLQSMTASIALAGGTTYGSGDFLSASCVDEYDDGIGGPSRIVVGFHDRGPEFFGNLVSLNFDYNATTPDLDEIVTPYSDFNDLEVMDDALWTAGEGFIRGAEVNKFDFVAPTAPATAWVLAATASLELPIFGASANSIYYNDITDDIWISSGSANNGLNDGGLIVLDALNPGADPVHKQIRDNAKHFDGEAGGFGLWLYANSPTISTVHIYNMLNYGFTSHDIGYAVTSLGKNAVDVFGNVAYLAMGADGVVRIDLDGSDTGIGTVSAASVNSLTGEPNFYGLANGVKTDGIFVYVAHGADGLVVYDMDLNYQASWDGDFNGDQNNNDGSCNYLDIAPGSTATTATLYVAFGRGGMNKIDITYP